MKTEKEKMLAGELYDPCDNELAQLRSNAHRLSKAYNATHDTETEQRKMFLHLSKYLMMWLRFKRITA